MRVTSALVLAIALTGCGTRPYLDLREPMYLVPKKSFWTGCEKHPLGPQVCRMRRVAEVFNGVYEWFRYFHPDHRPKVVLVLSVENLPANSFNELIYLAVDKNGCGKDAEACYNYRWYRETQIVFVSIGQIGNAMAHEFGHVLGRDDNDVPEGVFSVMSYDKHSRVTRRDFAMMCRKHHECWDLLSRPRRK